MYLLTRPGNILLIAVLVSPALVMLWLAGAQPWSAGVAPMLGLLGRLAGVQGMVMMLLAGVLSVRIPGLDKPFGGLTDLWKNHHLLGLGAFLLLMLHPLLLTFSTLAASPRAAKALLLPPTDAVAVWLGWGALLCMMVFLAPTFSFFGQPHYQRWKLLHALSAVAIVLAVAHTLPLSRGLPAWFWWLFTAVTMAALAYRLILRKIRPGRRFKITRVEHLAERVVEIAMEPLDGKKFTYDAGQFIYLAPLDPKLKAGRGEEHPYTISSAPSDPQVKTAILNLGDASGAIQQVAPGTEAWVDGPYGQFFRLGARKPELWVGGGIGITPFVGRARALADTKGEVDIHLIYCADSPEWAYYREELQAIAAAHSGFQVWPHYFREEGPLTQAWIADRCPGLEDRETYICGPLPLIRIAKGICRNAGIPRHRIHSEEFTFL